MATPTQPIVYGPSKMLFQRIGKAVDEMPVVVENPPAPPLPKKVDGERWFTGCDTGQGFGETVLTAEVSVPPEAIAELKRFVWQAILDDMVNASRAMRLRGFAHYHFEMAEEAYRHVSTICHRLHNMNLTRYIRSRCLYPAKGIRITLKSGEKVWKK